jgi:type IV secretion system protein VirB4
LRPDFEFFNIFVQGLSSVEVLVALIGFISAAAFAGVWATKLGRILLPQPQESRVADFLPFSKLMSDGMTIRCHDGSFVRVFKVEGMDLSFATGEKAASMGEARKSWIDSMSDLQVVCRVITTRDRIQMEEVEDNFNNPLLEQISMTWRYNLDRIYSNKHYVVLSVPDRTDALKDLNYASQTLLATLNDYGVKTMYETEDSPAEDSPIFVFSKLCSPISHPKPKARNSEGSRLNELLTSDHIHFTGEKGVITFFSGEQEKYAITMGIRSSGDYMDENMIVSLLSIDCEMVLLHNVRPIFKPKARALLMQQQRMAAVTSFSPDVVEQYGIALSSIEDSDADYQSLTEYAMTMIMKGDSDEEIEFAESEVQRICRLFSVTPVREGWVAQATFFNQFPTYEAYPRTYRYLSRVVASAVSFDKPSEGFTKSDWGPGAISVFRTTSGSPYNFQFHVSSEESAVAHCCIIGPTGQGKTTLLTFLAGQAMRHGDLKVFFFDRHRGAEIFTRAVQGAYVGFDGDEKNVSLNPFDTKDTPNNRAFLRRWLKAITLVDDAQSEKEIGRSVTTAFDYLRTEERIMKNLYKSCFSPTGNMRRELYRWVNPDQYGNIFNSENDSLDLSVKRFMAFDFTHIFEDETLAPAVISYIMHRIQSETGETGVPSLIMIDETAPMLKHPMFRDYFIIGLQEGRKKRQAYLCAFQQPNIIDKLGVGEVIRGQCQTVIFFRNPQATPEDYSNWNLTDRELDFIYGRSYREFPYAILLSRPATGESVIIDVNLGGLGPYLKIYNSGRKNVLLVEELIREYGEDNFVTKYLNIA